MIRRAMLSAMLLTACAHAAWSQTRASRPASDSSKSTTYDAVVRGMSCKQKASGEMTCEYTVGTSLRFEVVGVGQADVSVNFYKVDEQGSFSASMAPLNGCVRVVPRSDSSASAPTDLAFVSPNDGKVYRTWNACLRLPVRR